MSLQTAAEAVRQQGRGEDTMLIHMTPDEVGGLQQLAMAYGGSLTVNPETGLPEAGFLKSLLPTLIGAGLTIFSGGAINPLTAGLIVGGVEGVRSGDIGKGLMAGLGAYGGAGLTTAAAAAAPATSATVAGPGLTAGGAGTVTPTLSNVGAGLSNITSSGGAGAAARQAALTSLGGVGGASKAALAATAAPLSQPAPMPEVAQPEYNYDGPYKPTERQVRYPGPDRDPADSSEFQYFDVVNPSPGFEPIGDTTPSEPIYTYGPDAPRFAGIPVEMATDPERMRDYQQNPDLYSFAEGGAAGVKTAPTGYVAGRDAEFDYGFQPMANVPSTQPVQGQMQAQGASGLPGYKTQSLADLQAQGKIGRGTGFAGTNLTGQQHQSSIINHFLNHPQIGPQLRADGYYAKGGMTMDDGGFVIDAHTVSEIGNGSSDAGHMRLADLGGEPIKGPGDGTSDSIKANIGGVQEARIAKDENYLSKDDVKRLGGGNLKKGEKMLYKLMAEAHKSRKNKGRGQATGLDKLIARMA